jgi:hypothetical protein
MATSNRVSIFAVIFALLSVAAPAQVNIQRRPGAPQPRDPRLQWQQTGTASISGRITAVDSGVGASRCGSAARNCAVAAPR